MIKSLGIQPLSPSHLAVAWIWTFALVTPGKRKKERKYTTHKRPRRHAHRFVASFARVLNQQEYLNISTEYTVMPCELNLQGDQVQAQTCPWHFSALTVGVQCKGTALQASALHSGQLSNTQLLNVFKRKMWNSSQKRCLSSKSLRKPPGTFKFMKWIFQPTPGACFIKAWRELSWRETRLIAPCCESLSIWVNWQPNFALFKLQSAAVILLVINNSPLWKRNLSHEFIIRSL